MNVHMRIHILKTVIHRILVHMNQTRNATNVASVNRPFVNPKIQGWSREKRHWKSMNYKEKLSLPDFPTPFFPRMTTRITLVCCKTIPLRLRRILKYLSSKNFSRYEDIRKMSTGTRMSKCR
jgi:hypothetical protein